MTMPANGLICPYCKTMRPNFNFTKDEIKWIGLPLGFLIIFGVPFEAINHGISDSSAFWGSLLFGAALIAWSWNAKIERHTGDMIKVLATLVALCALLHFTESGKDKSDSLGRVVVGAFAFIPTLIIYFKRK